MADPRAEAAKNLQAGGGTKNFSGVREPFLYGLASDDRYKPHQYFGTNFVGDRTVMSRRGQAGLGNPKLHGIQRAALYAIERGDMPKAAALDSQYKSLVTEEMNERVRLAMKLPDRILVGPLKRHEKEMPGMKKNDTWEGSGNQRNWDALMLVAKSRLEKLAHESRFDDDMGGLGTGGQ